MPERKTVPSSWRYFASSEKSGMAPPASGLSVPTADWTYDTGRAHGAQIRGHMDEARMALEIAIMIEAQEGLTWGRWRRLAQTVEEAGEAGLFRSDRLTGLFGEPTRSSLACWASLTWLATNTRRLRFGPLVCPLTFYHPALLAKRAAAVAELSGGRLDLGIGAGWHEGEHVTFGIPFPSLKERLDRLEGGARTIRSLMIPVITGRTEAEVTARRERARAIFPRVPEDAAGWLAAGFLHGVVDQVRRDLTRWEAAGMQRVMLQLLDMEDLEVIGVIGRECL